MKISSLEEFKDILRNGKYISHIHTNFTDGRSGVVEYFKYAQDNGISYLIFTEHVRKALLYNFDDFLNEVKIAEEEFVNVKAIIGCEAKIMANGELDIPKSILTKINVIGIACHSFPKDMFLYKKALSEVFKNEYFKRHIRIWVHPGRFLIKNELDDYKSILKEMVNIAISEDVFIEKNLRENLPPLDILEKVPQDKVIIGYDAHSVKELESLRKYV